MLLTCHGIKKEYGGSVILEDVSLGIEADERVALIGANGAGKTTLLRILAGTETADGGNIAVQPHLTVGYLPQNTGHLSGDGTLLAFLEEARSRLFAMEDELRRLEAAMETAVEPELSQLVGEYTALSRDFEAADGYRNRSDVTGVLKGLGFSESDSEKPIRVLSGGERQRAALGGLLLQNPDILLLDEPTNHLDLDSAAWLETYLSAYRGAVLVVSHDRYFLDRVAQKVVEIERGRSLSFPGNYSEYSEKKAALRRAELAAWKKQRAEIAHQEKVIAKLRSFNREKSIRRAASREKILAKIEPAEKPQEIRDDMRLTLTPKIESGKDVLAAQALSKGYNGRVLFSDTDLYIGRGERVAVIGRNGTGKTTLLRVLTGSETADAGSFTFGTNVRVGYYDQEQEQFDPEKSLFDSISDEFPGLSGTEIRNVLAAFLFTGDDVFLPVSALSGGERGRLSLARLMLSGANLLILDEPTNHLDITSREILEDALCAYPGTVLCVSHDRYFINRVATSVLELSDCRFSSYMGNYDDYLEKRASDNAASAVENGAEAAPTAARADWLAAKEEAARARKRENERRALEDEITSLEEQMAAVDRDLIAAGSDHEQCALLAKERADLEARLNDLLEIWMEQEDS